MARKRAYHDVPLVQDRAAQDALRKLWDRIYEVLDRVDTVEASAVKMETAIATASADLNKVRIKADAALTATQIPAPLTGSGTFPSSPPSEPPPDSGVGDAASDGCQQAGSNGHLDPALPLDGMSAGMIICGTANEFPSLLVPTVDLPTREANQVELLQRMIWHLQQHGFPAGRQRNPSSAISKDKLTIQIAGVWHAFDVFLGASYLDYLQTHVIEVTPADTVPDGGTPD